MSKFKDSIVTGQGKALLFGTDKIIYTKAVLFSQDVSKLSVDDIRKITNLDGNLLETPIGIHDRGDSTISIEASFSNKGLTQDIDFNTVGWFAKPDGGTEILVTVSSTDGTQSLGAQAPGQPSDDAINLVMSTAVADSNNVTVTIDPAGQVTPAKLNSVINNFKTDITQVINDSTKVKDFPVEITDFNNLPDGTYRFSNLTQDQFNKIEKHGLNPPARRFGWIKSITITDEVTFQIYCINAMAIWLRRTNSIKSGVWLKWYRFAGEDELSNAIQEFKNQYDKLSENKADKSDTYTKAEVDKAVKSASDALTTKTNEAVKSVNGVKTDVSGNAEVIETITQNFPTNIDDVHNLPAGNFRFVNLSDAQFNALKNKPQGIDKYAFVKTFRRDGLSNSGDGWQLCFNTNDNHKVWYAGRNAGGWSPWLNIVNEEVANQLNSVKATADNALPKSGGTMNEHSTISWNGHGAIASRDRNIGGLTWSGATDNVKIYADNNANDNLDLAFDLGDDSSNHFSFRNNGKEVVAIWHDGHFTGTVDWNKINGRPTDIASNAVFTVLRGNIDSNETRKYTGVNQLANGNWLVDQEVVQSIISALKNLRGTNYYSNPNFNDLKTTGTYFISNPSTGNNAPEGSWGTLVVNNGYHDRWNRITQIYYPDNNWEPWYRVAVDNNWKPWQRFANTADLDSRIQDVNNKINQVRDTMPQVQRFTDENQAKNWSNGGGNQLRIALLN